MKNSSIGHWVKLKYTFNWLLGESNNATSKDLLLKFEDNLLTGVLKAEETNFMQEIIVHESDLDKTNKV